MSVFEIPQKQWATVMGANLSFNTVDDHPVERVTWEEVRGGFWPIDFLIPQTSFVGAVRAATGLDLASEAQWKYAFRADSAGAYNVTSPPIDNLGWYVGNSDGSGQHAHQEVGTRMPNAWGLYDMHGNVSEICGDWFNEACLADSTAPARLAGRGRFTGRQLSAPWDPMPLCQSRGFVVSDRDQLRRFPRGRESCAVVCGTRAFEHQDDAGYEICHSGVASINGGGG